MEIEELYEAEAMYEHPLVQGFLDKLRKMESSALEAMLSGPPEEMTSMRERVKVIRSLLGDKDEVARRKQQLESSLKELLTED